MNCKNGLGECHQVQCVLETCPNIAEFKLLRWQELTFCWFWKQMEFEAILNENLEWVFKMLLRLS